MLLSTLVKKTRSLRHDGCSEESPRIADLCWPPGGSITICPLGRLPIIDTLGNLAERVRNGNSLRTWAMHDFNITTLAKASQNWNKTDSRHCPVEPCDLSIVFMGDSLTRFQYFSLVSFLRHGDWLDPQMKPNLIHPSTFLGSRSEMDYEWTPWYIASTLSLAPFENCDCYREAGRLSGKHSNLPSICENRYFYDPERRNRITYLQAFGTATTIRGHWSAQTASQQMIDYYLSGGTVEELQGIIHTKAHNTKNRTAAIGSTVGPMLARQPYMWEGTWMDAIRGHVTDLDPDVVVLNAGLWEHSFADASFRTSVMESIADMQRRRRRTVVWKTTTADWDGNYKHKDNDATMCALLQNCLNITWTTSVPKRLYVDAVRFVEPIYRLLNEQLLAHLEVAIPSEVSTSSGTSISWYPPVPIPGLVRSGS